MASATDTARAATPAVLYAAKSSEDVHGSIPTQLTDARAFADAQGFNVVDTFSDEAFSAYTGNRGPDLERAKTLAAASAAEYGRCVLVAQDADRFARGAGDAPGAADHLGEVYFAMKRQGVELWTVRSGRLDLLRAAIEGERSHDESARKSQAVAAGHRRRFEAGKRLGSPIPDGYRLEAVIGNDGRPEVGRDGRAVRQVAFDPERSKVWLRIYETVERGHTLGQMRETLNREGVRKQRGGAWTTRDIRRGVLNAWYAGRATAYRETIEGDHPALIEPERWERIAAMVRTDQRASKGGRPPIADADNYLLRGVATCMRCDSSLYIRRLASGRHYICKAVREGHGCCDANYIPAEAVERAVLNHLDSFVANVRGWLEQQTAEGAADRDRFAEALKAQRLELKKLDVRAQRAHVQYERLLGERDDKLADAALRKAVGFEADRDALGRTIEDAEQRLAGWPAPDVDEALDVYQELRDAISGRVDGSQSMQDLRATLRSVLKAAHLDYRDGDLFGAFYLRASDDVVTGRLPFEVDISTGALGHQKWFAGPSADSSEAERWRSLSPKERHDADREGLPDWWEIRDRARAGEREELDTTC